MLLKDVFGEQDPESSSIFFGDSNDEPCLNTFRLPALWQISYRLWMIKYPPTYITEAEVGAGFTEAVRLILLKRG